MAVSFIMFVLALILLYKGGDLFVDAAIGLARRFKISEVLIGATIVSIGTTIPETTVSALASAGGYPGIAYGNALGSIICNTALIAGVLLLFAPTVVNRGELRMGTIFFFAAELVFALLSMIFNSISRIEGTVLFVCFVFYIWTNVMAARRLVPVSAPVTQVPAAPLYHTLILLALGGALLFVGSNVLVNNGTLIAAALGVPDQIIALTFIALGTSLPELVTAITAILKGHAGVSLGNIIGANILNLTSVLGLSAAIREIPIPMRSMWPDIILGALAMAILTLPALYHGKTSRIQGALLVLIYAWYCIFQMNGVLSVDATNAFAPFFIIR